LLLSGLPGHTKDTYLAARFHRLAARATVAVAHTILVSMYHVLKAQQPSRELGAEYWHRRNAEQLKRHLLKRLERWGSNHGPAYREHSRTSKIFCAMELACPG
jgi:hypothetical protein